MCAIYKAKDLIVKAFEVKDKIVESLVKIRIPGQNLTVKTDAFVILILREDVSKMGKCICVPLPNSAAYLCISP